MQGIHLSQPGAQRFGKGLATKEYIFEQASLKRDAHFDDKGRYDQPVLMEVDALLAKVAALKEGRGEKDEVSDGQ